MADRFLTSDFRPPLLADPAEVAISSKQYHDQLKEFVKDVPIIVVDNVAEYFYAGTDQEHWYWNDFPNVTPPFSEFWVEYRRPSKIVSEITGVQDSSEWPMYVGTKFSVLPIEDHIANLRREIAPEEHEEYRNSLQRQLNLLRQRGVEPTRVMQEITVAGLTMAHVHEAHSILKPIEFQAFTLMKQLMAAQDPSSTNQLNSNIANYIEKLSVANNIKCIVYTETYMSLTKGEIIGPCFVLTFQVDKEGHIAGEPEARFPPPLVGLPIDYFSDEVPLIYPALLALSFMHCKNVTVARQSPPKDFARIYYKKHSIQPVKYYTLEIQMMKEVLRSEGNSDSIGIKRALHKCRGHFKYYSEEKPLFGKVSGLYWWNNHMRGSKEVGEIEKRYEIKTPEPIKANKPER